jgi:hypothetical protein
MKTPEKYRPARLPDSPQEAREMAVERRLSASEARDRDLHGTAKELELTALLLEFFAGVNSVLTEGSDV